MPDDTATKDTLKAELPEDQILGLQAYTVNLKRIVDDYAQESLDRITKGKNFQIVMENLMSQTLQNSIETANMLSKMALDTQAMLRNQAIRHADSVIYNTDNPITVGLGNAAEMDAATGTLKAS